MYTGEQPYQNRDIYTMSHGCHHQIFWWKRWKNSKQTPERQHALIFIFPLASRSYRLWRLNLKVQAAELSLSIIKAHSCTLAHFKNMQKKPTMILAKFLFLTLPHDIALQRPTIWISTLCIFISLCIPSLPCDQGTHNSQFYFANKDFHSAA